MVHAPQGQGIGALRGLTLALLAIVISRSSVMARDWKSLIAKHSFNNTFTSRNTTLPYSLEELGLSPSRLMTLHGNATWHPQRRLLGQLGVCRARKNINFAGGGLEGGGLRMANVKSPAACCNRCLQMIECGAWSWSSRSKICYPKASTGWAAKSLLGVVSGVAMRPDQLPVDPKGTLIWNPTLVLGDNALSQGFAKNTMTYPKANNKYVITDPTGDSQDPVVKAVYQKGRWAPSQGAGGGVLFYSWPEGRNGHIGKAARLEYELYLPNDFPFVKGGKLPGLMGGNTGCGGGANAENCFSVRLMWRREGDGEAYVYLPKAGRTKELCSTPGTKCDSDAGVSLMRGAFKFETGRWMKIAITVNMNTIGQKNGLIDISIDGQSKIHYESMLYRRSTKVKPQAFIFATWFGGGDSSWAPDRTVEAYFRNFKIYKL